MRRETLVTARSVCFLALALVAGAPARGSEAALTVEVTMASAAALEVSGFVVAHAGDSAPAVRQAVSAPGRVEMRFPTGIAVRVVPEVEGFWGAPVAGVAGGEALTLRLFPTGRLRGTVQVPPGGGPPESLRARFQASPSTRALGLPNPEGAVDCPVADGVWTCLLPEGVLDLRLHAPGFASVLLWDVAISAGTENAGEAIRLVPGAAIFGQVAVEGRASDVAVAVELRPEGAGWRDAYGGERLGHLFHEVEPDHRGTFQFRDLAPGRYRIEARMDGRAPAVRAGVEVLEGRETDLGPPLALLPPSRLELQLDPLVAPGEERWTVRLSPLDGSADEQVTRVDWTGFGLFTDLAPGSYRYRVTSRGSTWSTGEVEVAGEVTAIALEVPLVPIAGIVRRGGEPARARIVLGGSREHPERVELFADPEGRFSGYLPREGSWPVFVGVEAQGAEQGLDPIEVVRAPGEEAAWIEISLFETEIRGRVVDDAERPVSRGFVVATRSGSPEARRTNARIDEEGRFRLRGVRPGTWTIDAMVGGDGGRAVVELAEGAEEDVEIRLSGGRRVAGRVVAPHGPVAAAALYLVPAIEQVYPLAAQKTGPRGEFQARVPRHAPLVHVLAMAPGYAARILSLPLPADGRPLDDVEIAVGEVAGTLRLELAGSGASGVELRRGPTSIHLDLLASWAGYHGVRPDESWELPAMEPGEYRLCRRGACESGTLVPGATLVLRLEGDDPPIRAATGG